MRALSELQMARQHLQVRLEGFCTVCRSLLPY